MRKQNLKLAMSAALLSALLSVGAAFAASPVPTCTHARITAWKAYSSCVDVVVAKIAKSVSIDEIKAFWKCRHAYFKKWAAFQSKVSLAGSPCVGARFTDNGNQTVTDNLTRLIWEKKDDADGVNDKAELYSWSSGPPYRGDGTAFATFLSGPVTGLNVSGFAGTKDWRVPTVAELQTLLLDYPCTGPGGEGTCVCTGPCIDPALDAVNTESYFYWTSTNYLPDDPAGAWAVTFSTGDVSAGTGTKASSYHVRAVRGGFE